MNIYICSVEGRRPLTGSFVICKSLVCIKILQMIIFPESPQTFTWGGSQNELEFDPRYFFEVWLSSSRKSRPLSNSRPPGNLQKPNSDTRAIFFELIPGGMYPVGTHWDIISSVIPKLYLDPPQDSKVMAAQILEYLIRLITVRLCWQANGCLPAPFPISVWQNWWYHMTCFVRW